MSSTGSTTEAVRTGSVGSKSGARAGKYLTFRLMEEEYGLEILKVREIIGLMDITRIPRVPEFVRGVINLRGKIIPVVDTRIKFGMITIDNTTETCIIVVEVKRANESVEMGMLVDAVSEVLDIAEGDIEDSPEFGAVDANFILGMAKAKGSVKILLDIDKVLTEKELSKINTIAVEQ